MTQEEKAKAYDMAIERAKEKYAMYEGMKQGDILEYVFPELKESKGEMIRNQIIEYIKWSYDEQECAEEEMHRWISWLKKHGEQKPTIEMKSAEESLGIDSETYNKIVKVEWNGCKTCGFRTLAYKQNPAWSEEDEKFVHGLIRGLSAKRDIHGHTTFSSDGIDITKTIDWLKSLKDKIQPKQEWSEQEQVRINRIVAYLENLNVADNDILLKDVAWLKSLRPQNRWKPSE